MDDLICKKIFDDILDCLGWNWRNEFSLLHELIPGWESVTYGDNFDPKWLTFYQNGKIKLVILKDSKNFSEEFFDISDPDIFSKLKIATLA